MKRILLMVLYNLPFAPFWWFQLCTMAAHPERYSQEKRWAVLQKVTRNANKGGRVTIESHGTENIPEKENFIFYPNHQGLFDVLAMIESCPRLFAVVNKKEVTNIPLLKQVFHITGSYSIDREDIRQSMGVINRVAEDVKNGKNFLIFAEGTRSKQGNRPQEFKGGSFKSAYKAKCPIVPVALMNAFIPFDKNTIERVTVKVIYLPPIPYEEYQSMKTVEIAAEVKRRIEEAIAAHSGE
ncbi:MAG TPA: 1-acyl-sn-glycerol-3-phosphate acyltransferase [Candidatus Eisenbergiella merdigallinarum]|uniref:1-acyl-sn-glycerol-3-phosphate acyltransferase n=1 Tax=Candidatus Eisenbergiella merdigallinarum TaxID=2838552 RepID=A0A9D2MT19_9FIRM|nr:1-acyl-sn-glycerol-3-phosphate acyltransferase [Candidatus Eisenbergiella merdigallinarum]